MTPPAHGGARTNSAVVQLLAEATDAGDAAPAVLETLARELGWDLGLLWAEDESGALLRVMAAWHADDAGLAEFRRISERLTFGPGVGLPGTVWASSAPRWLEDVSRHAEGFPRGRPAAEAGLRSAVAVPIAAGGDVVGVIELLSRGPQAQDPAQLSLLRTAAAQLAHYFGRLRAEDRLRRSEEHWRAISDAALDCIVIMDHRGILLDLNPAAEAVFGHPRDQAVGRLLADLIVPSDLRQQHLAGLRRYVESGEPKILNRRLELRAQRAGGETFPVELTVTRIGRREPPLFAGFVRDITDRQEAEAERRRLLKEALVSRAAEEAARVHTETARAQAEADRNRMEFLARAGLRMARSMDYQATLEAVARTAVPDIADWCTVIVVDDRGRPELVTSAHVDPAGDALAKELLGGFPPGGIPGVGAARVIATGEPHLVTDADREALADAGAEPEQLELLERIGVRSTLTVPVSAYGRRLGAITLALTEGDRRFSDHDLMMATALGARAGLHIENARLYTARSRIANTLQRSLLPIGLPTVPGLELAARHHAAGDQNQVGGDFYDVFATDERAWAAVVGDVSGKGARAAALTALARHSLYASSLREPSPAANLAFLNEAMLRRDPDAASFCTVVYARIEPGPRSVAITLACGGHPPALVLRADGRVEPVDARGTVIGAVREAVFEERRLELRTGDLLLMYTDGAVELRREELTFGYRMLEQVLVEHMGRPAGAVVDATLERVMELQDGAARDDIALVALRALEPDASIASDG